MQPHTGPIRWGIAATGKIAGQFADAFASVPADEDAAIAAVGSRTPERARAFADEHGIARVHGSYADLAADPDVDVVYVASLQPGHAADAVRFLEAGKHVLVEKPMALSAAQVDTMTAAAAANDRFLMEAMWMRFNPGPVAAVGAVTDGRIGPLEHLTVDFSIRVDDDPAHRLRSLEKGGGALLDLGIYPLTLAWWLLGPPTSWTVDGDVVAGVDTRCDVRAVWTADPVDVIGELTCGLDRAGSITADLLGRDGRVEIGAAFHAATDVTVTVADGHDHATHPTASLHHQTLEVHRCLRAGERESPRNPWATSRAILAWCDAIRAELGVVYPGE